MLIISRIRRKRPSLRLIISSATLDASAFLDYFSSSPPQPFEATVLNIPGRMYPVEIAYFSEPTEDYVKEAVRVVWNLHLQAGGKGGAVDGDVLVFLTGREEIERALYEFSELLPRCVISYIYCISLSHSFAFLFRLPPNALRMNVVALHAGLSTADQLAVFQASERGTRKVVISTNIAEASVTIDGIRFVIDSGFVKVCSFAAILHVTPLSRNIFTKSSTDADVQSYHLSILPNNPTNIDLLRNPTCRSRRTNFTRNLLSPLPSFRPRSNGKVDTSGSNPSRLNDATPPAKSPRDRRPHEIRVGYSASGR